MSVETVARVRGLPDNRVAPVLKEVFNTVFSEVPYEPVLAHAQATPELAELTSMTPEQATLRIPGTEAAGVGRELLAAMAEVPALEGFVARACDRVEASDTMFVGTMLVVSALVNLTYLLMATDIQVEQDADGKRTWSVKKPSSPPELIGKVVRQIVGLVPTA